MTIITIGIFPEFSKTAEAIPTYKKDNPKEKTNYRPIAWWYEWLLSLMIFYQNFSAAFEEVFVPKTAYYIW